MGRLFLVIACLFLVIAAFGQRAQAQGTCPPLPYNLLNGTIPDASQVMADLNALRGCINAGGGGGGGSILVCPTINTSSTNGQIIVWVAADSWFCNVNADYQIGMFLPGIPPNSAIVRWAVPLTVTCPANLPSSVGNASAAAAATTTINLNTIVAGSRSNFGTAVFATSGAVASFSAGSDTILSPGNDIEFQFPSSADASLADVALTLDCYRS